MRAKLFITFESPEQIQAFSRFCRGFDDAIDLVDGFQSADAKSMLGCLTMPCGKPIEVFYQCYDNQDDFDEFLSKAREKFPIECKASASIAG